MYRLIARIALAWLLLANTSLAAKDASKPLPVGSLVMARHPGVHFRIKNQDVEAMHCGVIERVQKVQGEWLWLGRGWVQRRQVLSLPEAPSYFTAEIRRKPTAFAYVGRAAANGHENGFTSETDNDIDQALKLDSEFAPAYYLRGVAFREGLQWDAARDAFIEATRYDRTFVDAVNDLGCTWYEMFAAIHCRFDKEKDLTDSLVDLFNQAIRLSPRLAKAYRNRAAVFLAAGEYERALSDAQESLKHDAADSAAYRLVGECWVAKGEDAHALPSVNEAVRLNPKCGKAHFVRGEIYMRQRDDEEALADLNLAIQLLPRSAEAIEARGLLYYRTGEIEKYMADRQAAARLSRKPPAKTPETKTCDEGKSKSTSNATYETWVKFFNKGPGRTNFLTSNDASAESKSIPPDEPKSAPAETPRSRASTLDASARRSATSTDERYLNGERAVEAATQACELTEWKIAGSIDTLAAAYAEAGDFDAAIKWQTKAIELGNAGPTLKCEAEQRLELYRDHKPCREDVPGRLAKEPDADAHVR